MKSWGYRQEHHDPGYEAVASPLKDIEKGGKKGGAECYTKSPAFQHVYKVEREGHLIKAMLLLEDKSLIQAKRQGCKVGNKCQEKNKENRLRNLKEWD